MEADAVFDRLWDETRTLTWEDLDDRTIEGATLRIFDAIAVGLRTMGDPRLDRLRMFAESKGGSDEGRILGTHTTGSVEYAGFANAAMIRHLDWNDSYLRAEAAHPSGNIGGILSLADAGGRDGREAILATVLAYELQCRLCDLTSFTERGFDHVNFGSVSVPLAYATLFDLDREQALAAVGIAVNGHVALLQARQPPLSEWKGYAFANVVRNGIVAGELGRAGVHGPSRIFTAPEGLPSVLDRPIDPDALQFDGGFAINETHLKRYPICHHILAGVDAVLALRREDGIQPDDVQSIEVDTYDIAIRVAGGEEKWRPTTRGTADHSIPYCLARALVDGPIEPDHLDADRLDDPRVRELMDRITIDEDESFSRAYGETFPHRVAITTANGTYERTIERPHGHYERPLDWSDVSAKLTGHRAVSPALAKELATAVQALPDADDLDRVFDVATRIGRTIDEYQHT